MLRNAVRLLMKKSSVLAPHPVPINAPNAAAPPLLLVLLGLQLCHVSCENQKQQQQCEATEDQIQLDTKRFARVPDSTTFVKSYSCAAYRANNPIEDRFDLSVSADGDNYVAVFDGHGGWQVAEYAQKNLIDLAKKEIPPQASIAMIEKAIVRSFLRLDRDLMSKLKQAYELGFGSVARVGSCACLAFIHRDTLIVANAGDIRAVIGKKSSKSEGLIAVAMSNDQNAMVLSEKKRLAIEHPNEENIVKCKHPQACYVKGALQPTRAFGDFSLKYSEFNGPPYHNGDRSRGRHFSQPFTPPYISAEPETTVYNLTTQDQFLIIGSDGLWDYLSNEEAVDIVANQILIGKSENASDALIQRVLEKASEKHQFSSIDNILQLEPGRERRRRHDDTTVTVVYFH